MPQIETKKREDLQTMSILLTNNTPRTTEHAANSSDFTIYTGYYGYKVQGADWISMHHRRPQGRP